MIQTIKQNKKAVLAFLLALVMLIGLIPFTATEVQAVTIPVGDITTNDSFGTGAEWQDGDELYFCRVSKDNQWAEYTLTANVEDEVTTWTPSEKLYWDDKGEHQLVVNYPADTGWAWDTWYILEDQSTLEKLKRADHMNAMWKGNPTTDPINLNLKHRLSMVTVTYTFASEFADEPDITPEVYSNTQYMLFDINTLKRRNVEWQEDHAIWVTPYQHDGANGEKQFTAIVSPDAYSAGDEFIRITIGDQVLTAKMKEDITFEEGTHYTFNLKVGKDKVTIEQVSVNYNLDSPFGDGWRSDTEEDLGAVSITDTQDEGKTAWYDGDQIIATLTSQYYGEQTAMLTFSGSDGTWSTDESFSYLEDETPTVSAIYAPCYEVVDGNMQLKDGLQLGMTEYILAACSVTDGILNISFDGAIRNYSRLRIFALPGQTLTVTTTDFAPAGATKAATEAYTLTADENGNVYLYGTFAEGATISVKQGDVVLKEYAFTAEKIPGGTEQGKSYALDATPIINLTQYEDGATIDITYSSRIIGDGTEYNLSLNIAEDVTVVFDEGTGGVKLNAITVADNKTLTLQVKGNVEHIVKEGISIGNGSNVIIEGERDKENNKLTVTATDGNAAIGANNGVTAGDITIRNARVKATGSSTIEEYSESPVSGAAIGTSDANMGDILIENSIITATGSSHSSRSSFAAAIGMGSLCRSIGNMVFIDSEITAKIPDETLASVIGAGSIMHGEKRLVCTMGDIIFTKTSLNLSIVQNLRSYGALIGIGETDSYHTVNMGKIIFTDMTQAELDAMIATWTYPEDFAEWGAYIIGRSPYNIVNENGTIGGVYVSDGNGGTVQVGNADGYNPTGYVTNWGW